jgi:carboxyl-terminal processing protease
VPKPRFLFQASLVGILGVAVLGSTYVVSRQDYSFFDPLLDVKAIISQKYVTDPDEKAMQLAAINGMVESLNDPYTVYVPPAESKNFTKELTGDYVGIGAQIQTRDGWLTIVTPLEDSPAFKAGILPDDRISEIEGKTTLGMSTDDSISLLTGEPGTKVNIVIERKGQKIPMTITRERIVTHTVKGFHWEAGPTENDAGTWQYFVDPTRKIAYIRLTQFTPTSGQEVADTLKAIGADKGEIKGLIFDLRGNPGGVLQDAEEIADLFLNEGIIVSTKGRSVRESVVRAQKEGTLPDFPMALLINGASASASEVLSGALTENNRAIAVGSRTFGKGLVQTVISLPSGRGQLKITEQRYYLPSGRSLHRTDDSSVWGVDPTQGFYVPVTDAEAVEMIKVRRTEEALNRGQHDGADTKWSDPSWILDHLKDKQLSAALQAVQVKIDTGEWKPTGQQLPENSAVTSQDLARARTLRDRLEHELDRIDRRIDGLESATGDKEVPVDLWPDSTEVAGGHVDVYDKEGKLVGKYKVPTNDLERWLIDAGVKKDEQGETGNGGAPESPKK